MDAVADMGLIACVGLLVLLIFKRRRFRFDVALAVALSLGMGLLLVLRGDEVVRGLGLGVSGAILASFAVRTAESTWSTRGRRPQPTDVTISLWSEAVFAAIAGAVWAIGGSVGVATVWTALGLGAVAVELVLRGSVLAKKERS